MCGPIVAWPTVAWRSNCAGNSRMASSQHGRAIPQYWAQIHLNIHVIDVHLYGLYMCRHTEIYRHIVHIYVRVCTNMRTYLYTYKQAYKDNEQTNSSIQTHIHTYTDIHTSVHPHICIYIYIYIYMHTRFYIFISANM